MSASTPGGFPYMEETDPLANVAQAIEDLANAVDPHAVQVSRNAAFAIPNGAFTDVPMTVEDTDVHGQSALAAGIYTVTLTEAGLYRLTGQIGIQGSAGGNARGMQVQANGVVIASSLIPNSGAPNATINASGLVKVGLATVIKMQAFQNSGAALNTIVAVGTSHAVLSAHRIARSY